MNKQTIELSGFRITIEQLSTSVPVNESLNSVHAIALEVCLKLGHPLHIFKEKVRDTLRANLRAILVYKCYGMGHTHTEIARYTQSSETACRYQSRRLSRLLSERDLTINNVNFFKKVKNNDKNLVLMWDKLNT